MDKIKIVSLSNISEIIDQISNKENWSIGADGDCGNTDPVAFLVLEEIYNLLGDRPNTSSIKFFKNVEDHLAYDWHSDDSNPTETQISKTALVYLKGCENSGIEFKDLTYYPKPYDLLIFDNDVEHRAVDYSHGPVLKYTFL